MQTEENSPTERNELKRDLYTIIIVLMFLLTINFAIWQLLKSSFYAKTESNIHIASFHLAKNIEQKFNNYAELLNYGKNFFRASKTVERNVFISFYQSQIQKYIDDYQDIIMFSFVEKTSSKKDFEKKIKSEVTTPANQYYYFSVHPDSILTDRYVVNYIYPWAENQRYFGYDVKTDSVFSSYFSEALEKGNLITTDPGIFVNAKHLLLIQPIYINGLQIKTIEERKTALNGFIVLFLDPDKMIDSIVVGHEYENIDISVFDGKYSIDEINDHQPIFIQKNVPEEKEDVTVDLQHIIVGSKTYSVLVRTDISSKQSLFEKYFPDVNLFVSSMLTISLIVLFIQLKSQNRKN